MASYYLHYCYYHKINNLYNSFNSNNSNNIFLHKSTSESGEKGSDSGFNRRKAFLHRTGSYRCKHIVKARWCVHLLFGRHPTETGAKHHVCPPAGQRHGPHIRPKVYIGDALPESPSGIVAARPEPTIAGPKHGDAGCSHGTFLQAPVTSRAQQPQRFITCPGTIPKPTS